MAGRPHRSSFMFLFFLLHSADIVLLCATYWNTPYPYVLEHTVPLLWAPWVIMGIRWDKGTEGGISGTFSR